MPATLLVASGIAIACVTVLAVVIFVFVGRRRLDDPACARCGYSVVGLQSQRCPECGLDLARHPPRPPHARARLAVWRQLALVLVICGGLGSIGGMLLDRFLPQPEMMAWMSSRGAPRSGLWRDVSVNGAARGSTLRPSLPNQLSSFTVTLTDAGGNAHTMNVDARAARGTYAAPDGQPRTVTFGIEQERSVDAIEQWMIDLGIEGDVDERRADAAAIAWMLHSLHMPEPLPPGLPEELRRRMEREQAMVTRPPAFLPYRAEGWLADGLSHLVRLGGSRTTRVTTGPVIDPWRPYWFAAPWVILALVGIGAVIARHWWRVRRFESVTVSAIVLFLRMVPRPRAAVRSRCAPSLTIER